MVALTGGPEGEHADPARGPDRRPVGRRRPAGRARDPVRRADRGRPGGAGRAAPAGRVARRHLPPGRRRQHPRGPAQLRPGRERHPAGARAPAAGPGCPRCSPGPGSAPRTIRGSGDIDVHIVTHAQMGRGRGLPRSRGGLTAAAPAGRIRAGRCSCPLLTLVLAALRGQLNLTSDVLILPGRGDRRGPGRRLRARRSWWRWPGRCCSTTTSPRRSTQWTIAEANNALALVVFVAVGLIVSSVVDRAARRTRQAARASAESELLVTTAGSVLRGAAGGRGGAGPGP